MHRRKAIRDAIVAALQTGGGFAVTRGSPNPDVIAQMPTVHVITGAEEVDADESVMGDQQFGQWLQVRRLTMTIECKEEASANDARGGGLDDALDALALIVEQRLGADLTLGGACDKLEYQGAEESDLSGDLEKPIGIRALEYEAIYRVDARDPQALEG